MERGRLSALAMCYGLYVHTAVQGGGRYLRPESSTYDASGVHCITCFNDNKRETYTHSRLVASHRSRTPGIDIARHDACRLPCRTVPTPALRSFMISAPSVLRTASHAGLGQQFGERALQHTPEGIDLYTAFCAHAASASRPSSLQLRWQSTRSAPMPSE